MHGTACVALYQEDNQMVKSKSVWRVMADYRPDVTLKAPAERPHQRSTCPDGLHPRPNDYWRTCDPERLPAERQICPTARPDVRPAGGDQRHLPAVAARSRA